jgi:hypothetical protein
LCLGVGLAAGSFTAVHGAIAVLGAIFLLRQDTRLLLAPPYGAGLLLIDDLAAQAIELRGVSLVDVAMVGTRTTAVLAVAAVGACASAAAAIAVSAAPRHSVVLTALGALAAVAALAAIVRPTRQRYGMSAVDQSAAPAEVDGP